MYLIFVRVPGEPWEFFRGERELATAVRVASDYTSFAGNPTGRRASVFEASGTDALPMFYLRYSAGSSDRFDRMPPRL